jgi:hypothetical protein
MGLGDTNAILRAFLMAQTNLTDLVGERIYVGKLPERAAPPALTFVTSGGRNDTAIEIFVEPSVQFNCWAHDPIAARRVYRVLYDTLFPVVNQPVTVDGKVYNVLWAREETHGVDLQDPDAPGYYCVLTYWAVKFKAGHVT